VATAQGDIVANSNAAVGSRNALYEQKATLQRRNRCAEEQEAENARAEKAGTVPRILVCGIRNERGDEIPQARVLADDVLNARQKTWELGKRDALAGVPLRATPHGAVTDWSNIQAWLR
jgi:hypothetical protein